MTEKERHILSLQAPSTRKCLERPSELDFEWLNRKIPKEAQVRDEEGNIFLNLRALTYEETRMEQGIRQKRGERLAQMRGEPDAKSVPEEKKLKGVFAFMNLFSREQIKEKFKALMGGVKSKEEAWREK